MFLAAEYDERAISQAAAFLDDPQGLREVLDAIQMAASVTAVARSVTGSVLPGKTGKPARSIRFLAGSRAELPKVLGGAVVIGDGATSSRSPASTTWPGGRHHRGAER
jgi:hypothetical protein